MVRLNRFHKPEILFILKVWVVKPSGSGVIFFFSFLFHSSPSRFVLPTSSSSLPLGSRVLDNLLFSVPLLDPQGALGSSPRHNGGTIVCTLLYILLYEEVVSTSRSLFGVCWHTTPSDQPLILRTVNQSVVNQLEKTTQNSSFWCFQSVWYSDYWLDHLTRQKKKRLVLSVPKNKYILIKDEWLVNLLCRETGTTRTMIRFVWWTKRKSLIIDKTLCILLRIETSSLTKERFWLTVRKSRSSVTSQREPLFRY